MNFVKQLFKGKEEGGEDVPQMKLGDDAGNAWYDEKAKKWRFKGEEIKEEEPNRSVLPPKKQNNVNSNSTMSTSSVPNNNQSIVQRPVSNQIQESSVPTPNNAQSRNNSAIINPLSKNQTISFGNPTQAKDPQPKIDPNSSVYFSCNEDKILEEIRKNNLETLKTEKLKMEKELVRNSMNYERIIKNYESKLKEMENTQQYLFSNFSLEKDRFQTIIHKNEIDKVNNKFLVNTLTDNIAVMEKENENWKRLITEYRSIIENQKAQDNNELENSQIRNIQTNFEEMFKEELNEKSKLVQELMDSYIFIAKVDKKNKSLINNLNALKNSYSKLLEFSSNQEKKFNNLIEEMKSNFVKKTDDLNNENQMKMNELNDHFIKRLEEKELELKEKVSNKEIEEKNQEMERAYDKIKDLEDERIFLISQQKLLTEEKNKKLEELSQETLKLHFENEEKSQSLEQYINFEKAYKDNINRLNELIFNHEKNNKNYDINLKNLKASLKELFKMNNIDQVDSKIFSKLNEINLFNSHEELVYIIKRYITYLRSFIIEFLKLKEEHNFYIKEKKALETDIVNLKVEKDIYQEHLNEKNLDLIQLEEINNTLKNRITSLEEENTNLKGKSVENDKEMINRLQNEIAFLTESNREKDLTIKSLNDNLNILTENISKLERNNYTLERNCEHLSRYEKYSELLETEKAELQKMIVGLKFELDKKSSHLNEKETLLNNIVEQAVKITSEEKSHQANQNLNDKELLLANCLKKISETVFSVKLEKNHLEKENLFLNQEIERMRNSKALLINEINVVNENKLFVENELHKIKEMLNDSNNQIYSYQEESHRLKEVLEYSQQQLSRLKEEKNLIESDFVSFKQQMQEKNNENTVPIEEYNSLEEKIQNLMELIQNNNEAYETNTQKLKQKNKKRLEKLMEELNLKTEENQALMNSLESASSHHNEQMNLLQKQLHDYTSQLENSHSIEERTKKNFLSILSTHIDFFENNQREYLNSVNIKEISFDTFLNCFQYLTDKLRSLIGNREKYDEECSYLKEENSQLIKHIETFKQEQIILLDNLKEKETERINLQETLGNLEMTNQSYLNNYHELKKTYETLLKESKSAEKIIEYKKKVENLVEEKLTIQNSNKLIIESLSNEIKELTTKLNEITQKSSTATNTSNSEDNSYQIQNTTNDTKAVETQNVNMDKNEVLQKIETPKKTSGGFLTNLVKSVFLTETEREKI